jgi:hypothetical protein
MQGAVSFFEFVHSAAALMLQRNRVAHTRAGRCRQPLHSSMMLFE